MENRLYFAYGSNMNIEQMKIRCPNAALIENVNLKGYRLAFRGNYAESGGEASILPEPGGIVEGVMWKITSECEASLDRYEGYPQYYRKQEICIQNAEKAEFNAIVYIMNEPYQSCPAMPSSIYLEGIRQGCKQNKISCQALENALARTCQELKSY